MQPGNLATVDCTEVDDDGAAVAPGPVRLHVAGALPGERVAARVVHVSPHGPEAWGWLDQIEQASPDRRSPACRAFGSCGGCVLEHWDYAAQLVWKRSRVARALALHDALAALPVDDCVASPRPLGYRNRSKLVVARGEGGLVLGAYAPRSHDVVDLSGCAIAEPPQDETAAALRALLEEAGVAPYDERALTGDLRHVVLRTNRDGALLAVWVARRPLPDGPALARAFRAARPEVVGVVEHVNRTRGNAIFDGGAGDERLLDGAATIDDRVEVDGRTVRLQLSAGAFFQANRAVAELAYAAIARGLAVQPGERVVDAYCGVGGIALTLAPAAGEVLGIESHAAAITDAIASAACNANGNARFVIADAAAGLAAVDRADVVVLNPPRKGCAPAVLTALARLAPRAIAYLSCDPDSLARDLAVLTTHGYTVTSITPFDMLPHTPHVEVLSLLVRR